MKSLFIGVDFDGTMVHHKYPEIGEEIDGALETVHELQEAGHKIILITMRSGERLVQAVEYLEENGVELYAVNENATQHHWTMSPEIFAHHYIDDLTLGIPLEFHDTGKPTVDWGSVYDLLVKRGVLQ